MPQYLLGNAAREVVKVSRNSVFWIADCSLPDHVKDTLTAGECARINGLWCFAFYADPQVGDIVHHLGHEWQVTARVQKVRKRGSRDAGVIGMLRTKYLGLVED